MVSNMDRLEQSLVSSKQQLVKINVVTKEWAVAI